MEDGDLRALETIFVQEHSSQVGIHTKRLKAGWDTTYLQRVLAGVN